MASMLEFPHIHLCDSPLNFFLCRNIFVSVFFLGGRKMTALYFLPFVIYIGNRSCLIENVVTYWLVCCIMCLNLYFVTCKYPQICSISRRLLLGTYIAPAWGSVSTGNIFFWICFLVLVFHGENETDACFPQRWQPWHDLNGTEQEDQIAAISIKNLSLFFQSFFLHCSEFWSHEWSCPHRKTWWTQSLKMGIYSEYSKN